MDEENFKGFVEKIRSEYENINYIKCPAFNDERVYFDHRGFGHITIKYKKCRSVGQQLRRFKLIPFAAKILEISHELQSQRTSRKKNHVYNQYALQGKIGGLTIRVIVGRLDNGKLHFLSVMDLR